MIDKALRFLKAFIKNKFGSEGVPPDIVISDVPKDPTAVDKNKIYFTLINIEEERIFKSLPEYQVSRDGTGSIALKNPEIRLNLYLLISAIFKKDSETDTNGVYYEDQLTWLSKIITYFQGQYVFEEADFSNPALNISDSDSKGLEKLIVELQPTTLDQNNQIWSALTTRLSPSVLYKVRLVVMLDEDAPELRTTHTVKGIDIALKTKS